MDAKNTAPDTANASTDRRNKRRVMVSQKVRVRPSDPIGAGFDEVQATINICRNGIYFPTDLTSYRKGMPVFVTFPYSEMPGSMNHETMGEVVRIDRLTHGRYGVAVHLKSAADEKAKKR